MARETPGGQDILIEASLSHSVTPHSVGLLRKSDQSDGETSTRQHTKLTRDRYSCLTVGFEPDKPASERPQTQAVIGKSIYITFTKF
jgi:hypothetical protein